MSAAIYLHTYRVTQSDLPFSRVKPSSQLGHLSCRVPYIVFLLNVETMVSFNNQNLPRNL